ncbi:MAG: hypothetical protein ACLFPR_03960, partial [Desulfococcaceae bacterium]
MNRNRPVQRTAVYLALSALALVYVLPILFMIVGSLKPESRVLTEAGTAKALIPDGASLENYRDVFDRAPFGRYLLNSLIVNA